VTRVFRFGWGALDQLPAVAEELGLSRLALLTTRRGLAQVDGDSFAAVFSGVLPHVPAHTVEEAVRIVDEADADAVVAVGGGSAVDTGKAVALALAERGRDVKAIAVPTTYAAAEWTHYFGVLDEEARTKRGGMGEAARPSGAVYDPALAVGLSLEHTVGTAMNALAHCAEALYAPGRTDDSDRHAHCGARAIGHALPIVAGDLASRYGRTRLLEGAMRSAWALADGGMALGHAMAQAVGGRYGVPHGAANAVCLAPALRFNEEAAPEALAKLGAALGTDDPIARVAQLAGLGGFGRLRDLGVPEDELDLLGEIAAARAPARANPRSASPAEVAQLFRDIW
jgi:maleylacetate reductase